jgi:hypothetical protein
VITGGTIATMICIPVLLAVCVGAAALARVVIIYDTDDGDADALRVVPWVFGVVVAMILAATAWGMYPWEWQYHEWTPTGGVVATVDSRLVAGDHSTDQKFVVTFVGHTQQYGVTDTRASGIRPGDTLNITCVRQWQYSGTDGLDCNFVSLLPQTVT